TYKRLLRWLMIGVSFLGLWSMAYAITKPSGASPFDPLYTFVVIPLVGATGGYVSLLRRFQTVPGGGGRLGKVLEMYYGKMGVLLQSLVTGAIFGIVLLVVFASGLMTGSLFPNFQTSTTEPRSFLELMGGISGDGVEFSKLLIWCFIAGFAE